MRQKACLLALAWDPFLVSCPIIPHYSPRVHSMTMKGYLSMAVMVQRVHLPLEADIGQAGVYRESALKHSMLDMVQ